jgi:hypothetical protein
MISEVVCIKTHSQGIVKEGEIYPLLDTRADCSCGATMYDIGAKSEAIFQVCMCGKEYVRNNKTWWLDSRLFAIPNLEEIYGELHLEEAQNGTH